jgi:hypothetical protein
MAPPVLHLHILPTSNVASYRRRQDVITMLALATDVGVPPAPSVVRHVDRHRSSDVLATAHPLESFIFFEKLEGLPTLFGSCIRPHGNPSP